MKKQLAIFTIIILAISMFRCEKDTVIEPGTYESVEQDLELLSQLPKVTTDSIYSFTGTTVTLTGSVHTTGGYDITKKGFCYATDHNPTIADSLCLVGKGLGEYAGTIQNLDRGSNVKIRAFATTEKGTSYGEVLNCTTANVPKVSTLLMSDIQINKATAHGVVDADNGSPVTKRGFLIGTENTIALDLNYSYFTDNGDGLGAFEYTFTNLYPNTTYYVRAYAINDEGVGYGNVKSFTITGKLPTVTTNEITNISTTTATCGGKITDEGSSSVTKCGVCWSTSQNPTINDNKTTNVTTYGSFTTNITGLTAGTTYYVRAYATNSYGTSYGEERSFKTSNNTPTPPSGDIPTLTTSVITNITTTSATSGGVISSNGGATITAKGVCWSTSEFPTINDNKTSNGSGNSSFTSSLTGLTPNTIYYVRAYATNSAGTGYGDQRTFKTSSSSMLYCNVSSPHTNSSLYTGSASSVGTGGRETVNSEGNIVSVADQQGNVYSVVQIGSQCWMAENMRATAYSTTLSGSKPKLSLNYNSSTSSAYYGYPNKQQSNVAQYGLLYNWYAAMAGSTTAGAQGICPKGWHVPSDFEWNIMKNYVSSQSQYICGENSYFIGKSLASTYYWNISTTNCAVGKNQAYNNSTGFCALPAGSFDDGSADNLFCSAAFWSSTPTNDTYIIPRAGYYFLHYELTELGTNTISRDMGCSVRCLRD